MSNLNLDQSIEIKQLALADLQHLFSEMNSSSDGLSLEQWEVNFRSYGKNSLTLEEREWVIIDPVNKFV